MNNVDRYLAEGVEHLSRGNAAAARASLLEAATRSPKSAEAHFQLARAHLKLGARPLAEQALRAAVSLDPRHVTALHMLGALLTEDGDAKAGIEWLRRAGELAPDNAQLLRDLGGTLLFLGEFDAGRKALIRAIKLDPAAHEAIDTLVRLQPMNEDSPAAREVFDLVSGLAGEIDRFPPAVRSGILYGMAQVHEDRGDYERAFVAMTEASAIKRATLGFEIVAAESRLAAIEARFTPSLFQRLSGQGLPSERPIFIFGMPRSGSTLVAQIISAHRRVQGGGERFQFPGWLSASRGLGAAPYPEWVETMNAADCRNIAQLYLDTLPQTPAEKTRVTDKWLENFENLGLFQLCLPNATLIHCRRDPRDLAISCFATRFSAGLEFTYDLVELGRYWVAYEKLMKHWHAVLPAGRILEVPYEAVVGDLETWARALIAHCGLAWDDSCLRFYESGREVRTASLAQVRRPVFTSSIGRWRPFARQLQPFIDVIGEPWASAP